MAAFKTGEIDEKCKLYLNYFPGDSEMAFLMNCGVKHIYVYFKDDETIPVPIRNSLEPKIAFMKDTFKMKTFE